MKKQKKVKPEKTERQKVMVKTRWLLLVILVSVLVLPFIIIKDQAILISAGSLLIVSVCYIFYTSVLIFMDRDSDNVFMNVWMGLPGEEKPVVEAPKVKKVRNVIDTSLPGAKAGTEEIGPEFDIDETAIKPVQLFEEVDEIEMTRCLIDLIQFWDGLSFYKITDSVVYKPETVKIIGELYDYVFSGVSTYLQRFQLKIDDLLGEDTDTKEYSQSFSSVVIGFIISLIEKEVATGMHQHIDKAEIIVPKIKGKNQNLIKVVSSTEFKHQVMLLIRQYYENQN